MLRIIAATVLLLVLFVSLPFAVTAKTKKRGGGLRSYDYTIVGVISRSGIPKDKHLVWLKKHGRISLVNLLPNSEDDGKGDITKLPSFKRLGFTYLHLSIAGASVTKEKQVKTFLDFATNKKNKPMHIFCRAGNARTGVMVTLYRYSVQGWTMKKALKEARGFGGGLSHKQRAWLREWAKTHNPGTYKK